MLDAAMETLNLTALSLEYVSQYGTAGRDLNVLDFINDPTANGECSVFGLSFEEEAGRVLSGDFCTLSDDGTDTLLVTGDSIEPLP
jgi:hypothetical protein